MSETPQRGNPNGLTRRQHVFPVKLMREFCNTAERVVLVEGGRKTARLAKVTDAAFCADRAWDQRAEAGYMKAIEDRFQSLCASWNTLRKSGLSGAENKVITEFYALWYFRSRRREVPWTYSPTGASPGNGVTKELHEVIEKKHAIALRDDGQIAYRHVNGIQIQFMIDSLASRELIEARWGMLETDQAEILVPDVIGHTVLPIAPSRFFALNSKNGKVTDENLAEINNYLVRMAGEYMFMHSPSKVLVSIYGAGRSPKAMPFSEVLSLWSYRCQGI